MHNEFSNTTDPADIAKALHDRLHYATNIILIGPDPDDPDQLFSESLNKLNGPCLAAVAAVLHNVADNLQQQHDARGKCGR